MAKKLYSGADVLKAKRAMLDHLAALSGGVLIPGCCTQGCCDDVKREGRVLPELTVSSYSRDDMLSAKRAMLSTLAQISGGTMIPGCCTQGCCDDDGIAAVINVP